MKRNSSRQPEKAAGRKVVRLRGAGKTIVLGVTGSIAAYKSAELASLLVKQGHQVFAVMSFNARLSSVKSSTSCLSFRFSSSSWRKRRT